MNSDTLSNFSGAQIYSIIGLILFVVAFTGVVFRVARMDRKEIDMLSRLPLDDKSGASNGDTGHE